MAIDKGVKKKVIDDWQKAFPELKLYSKDKFYKITGPLVIGIELIKLPGTDEYRPHFVIYSLCGNKMGNDIKACLAGPILLKEYYNKKGLQYSIPYEKHSVFFDDLLDSIKKQSPISFDGNISFKKLVDVLDEYSETPPLSAAPNSYLQAALQEAKLKIALFIGIAEAQSVLEQINKRNWGVNHFKACGVHVNEWQQSLKEAIANRDEFLKQIEVNKQDKKIAKLQRSDLIV